MVYFFLSWCYFLFRLDFAIMSSGIYVLFDALFTDLNNVAVYVPKWINMRYATRHARLAVDKSNMGNCQHLYDRWYKIELDYQARQVAPSSSPSRLPQLRPSRLHCPEWGTRVKIFKVNLNMLVVGDQVCNYNSTSNFRGNLKEGQVGRGTQNSYLSWEIKTLRSIQCQDLQFLDLKR